MPMNKTNSFYIHPAFNVLTEEDFKRQFDIAKEFFKTFPEEKKLHRDIKGFEYSESNDNLAFMLYFASMQETMDASIQNSFIRIDDEPYILMLASVKQHNRLGKGSFGYVKLAIDENKKIYAVKIVRQQSKLRLKKTMVGSDVEKEFEKLKDLGHGYGQEPLHRKNKLYIVQKFLGKTLSQKLVEDKLDFHARIALAAAVSLSVSNLHRGLLSATNTCYAHGDLKPDNIAIQNDEINLIDFGSCMVIGDPSTYNCKGTAAYLPIVCSELGAGQFRIQSIGGRILLEKGPVYCDLIALKRVIYLPKSFQKQDNPSKDHPSEDNPSGSILRSEDFSKLPEALQRKLDTEQVADTSVDETAIALANDLFSYLKSLKGSAYPNEDLTFMGREEVGAASAESSASASPKSPSLFFRSSEEREGSQHPIVELETSLPNYLDDNKTKDEAELPRRLSFALVSTELESIDGLSNENEDPKLSSAGSKPSGR